MNASERYFVADIDTKNYTKIIKTNELLRKEDTEELNDNSIPIINVLPIKSVEDKAKIPFKLLRRFNQRMSCYTIENSYIDNIVHKENLNSSNKSKEILGRIHRVKVIIYIQ